LRPLLITPETVSAQTTPAGFRREQSGGPIEEAKKKQELAEEAEL